MLGVCLHLLLITLLIRSASRRCVALGEYLDVAIFTLVTVATGVGLSVEELARNFAFGEFANGFFVGVASALSTTFASTTSAVTSSATASTSASTTASASAPTTTVLAVPLGVGDFLLAHTLELLTLPACFTRASMCLATILADLLLLLGSFGRVCFSPVWFLDCSPTSGWHLLDVCCTDR